MRKELLKIEKITKTELLSIGWTKKLIEELLPVPELKVNPRYKNSPKMKLWNKNDVDKAMQTIEFTTYQEKAKKKRQAAQKAVDTKINNLMQEISKKISNINVSIIDFNELVRLTLEAKQNWYNQNSYDYNNTKNAYETDKQTINRWVVNYIRHNLTDYDENLYNIFGKVGCHDAYIKYRKAVLNKIVESYPEYREECLKQF